MRWSRRPHAAESSRPESENVPAQRWHDKRAEMHGSVAERSISWTEGCKLLLIPFLNGALLAYFARRELRSLARQGSRLQVAPGLLEYARSRVTSGHRDPDPPYRDANLGANLEQPQADGRALCSGHLGALQPQSPQRFHQTVGDRRKVQPQLIRPHIRGRGPIGEKSQLLFLNTILRLAPSTIKLLVQDAGLHGCRSQRGHRKAGIFPFRQILRFPNHPSPA